MRKTFVFAAMVLFAGAASAQQYKWVDKDGKIRYGDVPPAGADAARLKPPPASSGAPSAPSAAASKEASPPLTPEQAFRKRQEDAEKAREKQAKSDQDALAKKDNCDRAQQALRTLQSGQRIARTDAKGERYYLDDSQIAQETGKARQDVKDWCG